MSHLAVAALIEKQRREALRAAIRKAVAARFEVTQQPSDRVRRRAVYRHVAGIMHVRAIGNDFCIAVRTVVDAMGAQSIVDRHNRHLFSCLRERAERDPPRQVRRGDVSRLRRLWERRLKASGFHDIETASGFLTRGKPSRAGPGWWDIRREINTAFFSKASDHYWRIKRHLDVWALYVFEALSVAEIAAKLDMAPAVVGRIVKAQRVAMGWDQSTDPRVAEELRGHPSLVQETGDGSGEDAEGQDDT